MFIYVIDLSSENKIQRRGFMFKKKKKKKKKIKRVEKKKKIYFFNLGN